MASCPKVIRKLAGASGLGYLPEDVTSAACKQKFFRFRVWRGCYRSRGCAEAGLGRDQNPHSHHLPLLEHVKPLDLPPLGARALEPPTLGVRALAAVRACLLVGHFGHSFNFYDQRRQPKSVSLLFLSFRDPGPQANSKRKKNEFSRIRPKPNRVNFTHCFVVTWM